MEAGAKSFQALGRYFYILSVIGLSGRRYMKQMTSSNEKDMF
jgi:hypothetical protein